MTRSPVDGRLERGTLPDIVSTERLQLRPWSLGDVDEVFAYARDPKWSRFLHLVPVPYGRRDAEIFVARQLLLDRVTHPSWAITLDGAVIGGINIRFVFDHRLGELGYSVARAHPSAGGGPLITWRTSIGMFRGAPPGPGAAEAFAAIS